MSFKIIKSEYDLRNGMFHMDYDAEQMCGSRPNRMCSDLTREEVERVVAELTHLLHEHDEKVSSAYSTLADWEKRAIRDVEDHSFSGVVSTPKEIQ
jgi:hypothetical protein